MQYKQFYESVVENLRAGSGAQVYGRCPFHEDKVSSLSINLETGLWTCHAGCDSGNVSGFASRLGLPSPSPDTPGWSAPRLVTSSEKPPCARPLIERKKVAEYIYQYEDGSNAFKVVRYDPKGFSQYRWEGSGAAGAWVSGTKDIRRVPYRLPQILSSEKTIFIVEGEKDVHKIESVGLVATTMPMGTNSWNNEFCNYFRGKRVAVIPDNDLPGKTYAKTVATDLALSGVPVKIVELPGLNPKGDVSDYLDDENNSGDTLLVCVRSCPTFKPITPDMLSPVEYLARKDIRAVPGKSLLPGEFLAHAKECLNSFFAAAVTCSDQVARVLDEIDTVLSGGTVGEHEYNKFLSLLKKAHQVSMI